MKNKKNRKSSLIPLITVLFFISVGLLIAIVEKIQIPVKEVAYISEEQASDASQVYIIKGQKSFYSLLPSGEKLNVFQVYQQFTDDNVSKVYLSESVINYWIGTNLRMSQKEDDSSLFSLTAGEPNVRIIENGDIQVSNTVEIKVGNYSVKGEYQTLGRFEENGLGWRYEVSNVDAQIGGCPLPGVNHFFFALLSHQFFEKKSLQDVSEKWKKVENLVVEGKFIVIEKAI